MKKKGINKANLELICTIIIAFIGIMLYVFRPYSIYFVITLCVLIISIIIYFAVIKKIKQ